MSKTLADLVKEYTSRPATPAPTLHSIAILLANYSTSKLEWVIQTGNSKAILEELENCKQHDYSVNELLTLLADDDNLDEFGRFVVESIETGIEDEVCFLSTIDFITDYIEDALCCEREVEYDEDEYVDDVDDDDEDEEPQFAVITYYMNDQGNLSPVTFSNLGEISADSLSDVIEGVIDQLDDHVNEFLVEVMDLHNHERTSYTYDHDECLLFSNGEECETNDDLLVASAFDEKRGLSFTFFTEESFATFMQYQDEVCE